MRTDTLTCRATEGATEDERHLVRELLLTRLLREGAQPWIKTGRPVTVQFHGFTVEDTLLNLCIVTARLTVQHE